MKRYLSTYYFHGQDLCIVPRHVKEDVAWMADHHVDGVFVGMHEADLLGGNTEMVCNIIREAGLDVWLIPSRVGGLVAGWGRHLSCLSIDHPEWWGQYSDGRPRQSYGPQVSVFHPDVPEAVSGIVSKMLRRCPATGIVWDEVKTLHGEDCSKAAITQLGRPACKSDMVEGTVKCFSEINRHLKACHPQLRIACFLPSGNEVSTIERCAQIDLLDEFGCDGKCYYPGESEVGEGGSTKVLLGGNDAIFADAAKRNELVPFTLLETQLLDRSTLDLSLSRIPQFLSTKTGHLVYYYYPYGMENPDYYMTKIGEAIADWRAVC